MTWDNLKRFAGVLSPFSIIKKLWWILFHRTFKPIYFARWRFEEQIKRPYFHVKPLERAQLKNWHEYLEFMKVSGHSLSWRRNRVIHWVHEGIGSFTDFDKYGICKVSVPVCHIECLKKNTGQFSGAEPVLILSKSRRFGFPAGRMSSSLASKASLWTGKVKIRKDRLQPKKLKLKKAGLRYTLSNFLVLSLEDLDSWLLAAQVIWVSCLCVVGEVCQGGRQYHGCGDPLRALPHR